MREVRPAMTIEPFAAPEPTTRPARDGGATESGAPDPALDWVSRLPSSAAPGFFYLAGACRGVPVTLISLAMGAGWILWLGA
jgi:hypothetical protein